METFSLKPRKLILSDAAVFDILDQASWYREREGSALALRWERALTLSLLQLTSNPLIGALCRFKAPELQGIRRLSVRGFPKYLVFYRTFRNKVTVLRIVHGARDLESLL